jgi:hypothetical protein
MDFLDKLTTTQRYLVMAILAVVIYLVSATASYSVFSQSNPKDIISGTQDSKDAAKTGDSTEEQEDPNQPKSAACPLNGSMHVEAAKARWDKRRPLAVMIENHQEARPQSGLTSADVVYETVAEGGITRFMAVFYCNYGDVQVGPVRSARTYFLDWLSEYDALYAHVGGANTPGPADALGQIEKYGIKDLNQFSIGFPTYWRDYQRLGHEVATEHTMYSTIQKLWDVGAKRGWTNVDEDTNGSWDENFVSWKFKEDQPGGTTIKAQVPFWQNQGAYDVQWDYNQQCNCYMRTNGGQSHIDLNNKKQIAPKNIVVQFEEESHANDGYENNVHLLYATNGSKGASTGKALIFQDGKVITGKWTKATRISREKFTDDSGKEIQFNKGQIWIQTVPVGSNVTY